MRRGELLGLRWSDVDLNAGTATVNQTLQEAYGELHFKEPKTTKSRRRITLPALVVEALRAHRAEQAKKRLRREPGWTDPALVLAAPNDGPWWPSNSTASGGASRRSRRSSAAFTTCAIRTPPSCSRPACSPRSSPSALGTPRSASPWTPTAPSRGHAGGGRGEDRRGTAGGTGRLGSGPSPAAHGGPFAAHA